MTSGERMDWGRADLHIHTTVSDGMMSVVEMLAWVEQRTDLAVIAVTDHDTVEGGLRARDLAARNGSRLQVIVGEEVTTRAGHLLALFIERTVPRFLSLEDTLQAIHEQGGLAVVPHPFSPLTYSIGQKALERALASGRPGVTVDALETRNHSIAGRIRYHQADRFNARYRLPETGGSDAHFLPALGAAFTSFPGRTADDLRAALRTGATRAMLDSRKRDRIPFRALAAQQLRSLVLLPARTAGLPLARRLGRALFSGG